MRRSKIEVLQNKKTKKTEKIIKKTPVKTPEIKCGSLLFLCAHYAHCEARNGVCVCVCFCIGCTNINKVSDNAMHKSADRQNVEKIHKQTIK